MPISVQVGDLLQYIIKSRLFETASKVKGNALGGAMHLVGVISSLFPTGALPTNTRHLCMNHVFVVIVSV